MSHQQRRPLKNRTAPITRRGFLWSVAGMVAGVAVSYRAPVAQERLGLETTLIPRPGTTRFFGLQGPETAIWGYNESVPGPELRLRQGERLRVHVENRLLQPTTVHWHGLRIPLAMDGVPGLSQPPIEPGAAFTYDFEVPDAGTFWYHPHVRSSEQQGRGLYGALIVEEAEPPQVDREAVWVIDDWRLDDDDRISETFDHPMDLSHAGRIGNFATLNGQDSHQFQVRAGERLRLRLINTANARIFALQFEEHRPWVIALDGQPVQPHEPPERTVILPPAGRADVILDMEGEPGRSYPVIDRYYRRQQYKFLELAYGSEPPIRSSALEAAIALPANPLPEPNLESAQHHQIILAGGAMGGLNAAILKGRRLDIRDLARRGKVWAINGIVADEDGMDPLLELKLGQSQRIEIINDTAFPHPMHLHGHSFRLLTRNGGAAHHRPWLDTVLVEPRERVEVAFVADNPGDWLFHCHVLEHMQAGMAAVLRVA